MSKKPYRYDQLSDTHKCRNKHCRARLKMNLIYKKSSKGVVPSLYCYKCWQVLRSG